MPVYKHAVAVLLGLAAAQKAVSSSIQPQISWDEIKDAVKKYGCELVNSGEAEDVVVRKICPIVREKLALLSEDDCEKAVKLMWDELKKQACSTEQAFQVQANDPTHLKNIGYLGLGYDIIYGNPHGSGMDVGFRQPIFNLTIYSGNRKTPDQRYAIPDHTYVQSIRACSFDSEISTVSGSESLHKSLSEDVSVDGEGWGCAFSASTSYQDVVEETKSYHSTYVNTKAKCDVYQAALETFDLPEFDDGFKNAVSMLTTDDDDDVYREFIKAYGTHYTTKIRLGSKAVFTNEFHQVNSEKLKSESVDVDVAVKAVFEAFTGGASSETEYEKEQRTKFEKLRNHFSKYFVGAAPADDADSWYENALTEPLPFQYDLKDISEALTSDNFPSDKSIDLKKSILKAHLKKYCSTVHDCVENPTDPANVGLEVVSNLETGWGEISCTNGKVMMSCGYEMKQGSKAEPYWSVYPENDNTCRCYDDGYGKGLDRCYATCVEPAVVPHRKIVHNEGHPYAKVKCPSGYKVTGCGMKVPKDKKENYPFVWPSSETECDCYNAKEDVTCFARCSKNIVNYTIRSSHGTDVFDVNCPEATFALGCGYRIKSPGENNAEHFPAFFPKDQYSCSCYNYYGATCYAICGVIVGETSSSFETVNVASDGILI